MIATCLDDSSAGFTKGKVYPVLAVGETTCMMLNDDSKLVGIGHAAINDENVWKLEQDAPKKSVSNSEASATAVPEEKKS